MLRLNPTNRDQKDILFPSILKQCIQEKEKGPFEIPCSDSISSYDIVICTCIRASEIFSMNVAPGHFTHIQVDEAAECNILEAIVPLQLANETTSLVFVGDENQLGPVVRSIQARYAGFDKSVLERLNDQQNDRCIQYQLDETYRSHPGILRFQNELFQKGRLKSKKTDQGKNVWVNAFVNKQDLSSPVLVHHVDGVDEQKFPFDVESESEIGNKNTESAPSWVNQDEIKIILNYIQELTNFSTDFDQESIGIITIFRQQVQEIKGMIHDIITGKIDTFPQAKGISSLRKIKVGLVEQFQGQERDIIFISCVRSNPEEIQKDQLLNIGLSDNNKRMNVAISRAIDLLIIVGNIELLNTIDKNWIKFIKIIQREEYINCQVNKSLNSSDQKNKKIVSSKAKREMLIKMVGNSNNNVSNVEQAFLDMDK